MANDCHNGVEVRLKIMFYTETTSVYVLYIITKPAVNGETLCKKPVSFLFVFLALQHFWLYFHSPVAGFSLFFEVS